MNDGDLAKQLQGGTDTTENEHGPREGGVRCADGACRKQMRPVGRITMCGKGGGGASGKGEVSHSLRGDFSAHANGSRTRLSHAGARDTEGQEARTDRR